jgi:general stress protein 26
VSITMTELRKHWLDLMETAEVVYLSTLDEAGFPDTRAMYNLRRKSQFPSLAHLFAGHEVDLLIYLGANTSSRKIRHIRANPRVAVYYCDSKLYHSLLLQGMAELVEDGAIKAALWQPGWERYYPGGPEDPDYAVVRLVPTHAKGWWDNKTFDVSLAPD